MADPKMTRADADGTPKCPHCSAPLLGASVKIEDLMEHFPFGGAIAVGPDGYAREDEHLTSECVDCHKPFAIGFNPESDDWYSWQIKMVAARTKKDDEYLTPDATAAFFDKAVRIQTAVHCGVGA